MTLFANVMGMPGFAQTGKGTIDGRVTDATGAVLRAARVEVQPVGQSTFTDDQGQYAIPICKGASTGDDVLCGIQSAYEKRDGGSRASILRDPKTWSAKTYRLRQDYV